MEQARAVVVDSQAAGRFAIRAMPVRVPLPSQALVRVKAISLNLGEVRRALTILFFRIQHPRSKPKPEPKPETSG